MHYAAAEDQYLAPLEVHPETHDDDAASRPVLQHRPRGCTHGHLQQLS